MPDQTSRPDQKPGAQNDSAARGEAAGNASIEPAETRGPASVKIKQQKNAAVDRPEGNGEKSISERTLIDRINRSDRWMIFFTAIIAAGGIVSAVIFGFQLKAMRDQLKEMQGASVQTDKTIAAFERLADAAKAGVDIQKQTSEAQLRAYINIEPKEMAVIGPQGVSITIHLRNTGQTPAYQARISVGAKLIPPALSAPKVEDVVTYHENRVTIFPNIDYTINAKRPLFKGDELAQVRATKLVMYVCGRVIYSDIFSIRRETGFCSNASADETESMISPPRRGAIRLSITDWDLNYAYGN